MSNSRRYPERPILGVGAIIERAGAVLLIERGQEPLKGIWSLPGGAVETGEYLKDAIRREVREETGLEVSRGRLAALDFRRPREGRPGGIRFLFDCGQLSDKALAGLKLQAEEISESRLLPLPGALALLRGPIRRRVRAATEGRAPRALVYLEDGRPV